MSTNKPESLIFCDALELFYSKELQPKDELSAAIRLFKIELSEYADHINYLTSFLTAEEAERAMRYRHRKDHDRFIICRSLLKYILAETTRTPISTIYFEKTPNHKPYLPTDRSVFFNVSHSSDFAVIAIGPQELGVDLEYRDANFGYQDILPQVFNKTEIKQIQGSENGRAAFYKFWTRKEALVKAIGKGIDDDLKHIPVTDGFHYVSASLLCNHKKINVFSFNLNTDYVGALAVTGSLNDYDQIVCCLPPTLEQLKLTH